GVVDVELAGRRDQARILDHRLRLERLVVDDDDRRFLVLRVPYREPHLISVLVEFGLYHALRTFAADLRPLRDRQNLESAVEVADVEHRDRLADLRVRVERRVDVEMPRFRMRLDEERAAALALQ